MRLHLIIQRHGLPPTHILWNVLNSTKSQAHTTGTDIIISQLLEQVDDVIPLESDDWGLEDYAVEVKGFECLHFSELGNVLRDEDEVHIRPLQTADLRVRKISGRHQVSADGKHLIDGIPFGRPYLRRAERPAIRIPPRKRRRITYGEGLSEVEDYDEHERQTMVRGKFEDTHWDHEYDVNRGAHQMLDTEGNNETEDEVIEDGIESRPSRDIASRTYSAQTWGIASNRKRYPLTSRDTRPAIILEDGHSLELVDENGQPYPQQYDNALLDYLEQCEEDLSSKGLAAEESNEGPIQRTTNQGNTEALDPSTLGLRPKAKSKTPASQTVRFKGKSNQYIAAPADLTDDEENDEDFQPPDDMEVDYSDATSSEGSSDINNMPDTSSSLSVASSPLSPSSITSSSLSSSSSSSSSEDEAIESAPEMLSSLSIKQNQKARVGAATSPERDVEHQTGLPNGKGRVKDSSPFCKGLKATKRRNARRRTSRKRKALIRFGELEPGATNYDADQYLARKDRSSDAGPSQQLKGSRVRSQESAEAFQARREELLSSLESGGVDVGGSDAQAMITHEALSESAKGIASVSHRDPGSESALTAPPSTTSPTTDTATGVSRRAVTPMAIFKSSHKQIASEPSQRRNKLDIASSRRLLFGSLGLRTPKTKDDEQKIRDDLMKFARLPATQKKNPYHFRFEDAGEKVTAAVSISKEVYANNPSEHTDSGATFGDSEDSWKAKINLSAVECCHEGVKLSTPPFPFVQRWDPQQQGDGLSRKDRKKLIREKKRKRDESFYYEDNEHYYDGQNAPDVEYAEAEAGVELKHDDPVDVLHDKTLTNQTSDEINNAVNEQLMRDVDDLSAITTHHKQEEEDLIALPKDLSSQSLLSELDIHIGCVIAFKQLDMSEETNWQPSISDYRTARINKILDDGTLQMMLAYRDRKTKNMTFDEKTGDRVYGKFEMPGYDGDGALENEGFLEIGFEELIEPKLLQAGTVLSCKRTEGTIEKSLTTSGDTEGSKDTLVSQENDHPAQANGEPVISSLANGQTGEPIIVSDTARKEISQIIRDAGFRSSLGSVVAESVDNPATEGEVSQESPVNSFSGPSTPRFNGFSSSSPQRGSVVEDSFLQTTTTSIPKTQFTGESRPHSDRERQMSQNVESPIVPYPQLPIVSSQPADADADGGIISDGGFGFGGDDTYSEIRSNASEEKVENSQPEQNTTQSSPWAFSSVGLGPSTLISDAGEDDGEPKDKVTQAFRTLGFPTDEVEDDTLIEKFEIETAIGPSEHNRLMHALDTIAKARDSESLLSYTLLHWADGDAAKSPTTKTEPSSVEKPRGNNRSLPASSDNEFPSLESVISTARSSFDAVKEEDRQSAQPGSQSELGNNSLHAIPPYRAASKESDVFIKEEEEEDYDSDDNKVTPKKSSLAATQTHNQAKTRISYVVDLTQSSDPLTPKSDDDESGHEKEKESLKKMDWQRVSKERGGEESSSLPSGPGWVKKERIGGKRARRGLR